MSVAALSPRSSWVRRLGVTAGLTVLAAGGLWWCMGSLNLSGDDLCANDRVEEVVAPGGEWKAVTFRRNGGATTDYSTNVSILPAREPLPNEAGNVLAANGERVLTVHWVDARHLRIGGGTEQAGRQRTEFRGVTIRYE